MKKIWLTLAGSLVIALTLSAQERSDTTKTTTTTTTTTDHSDDYRNTDESGTQSETSTIEGKSATQGQSSESYEWRDEDRLTVTREELPPSLVETLKSDEYEGWENATIYRNKNSEDYMLVIQDNGSVRTFYFDKEGKSKPQDLDSSSGDQSSSYSTDQTTSGSSTITTETETETQVGQDQNSSSTTDTNTTISTGTSAGTTTPAGSSSSTLGSATQPSDQPSAMWRDEDRIIILADDLPAKLRITLEDDQYKGWENSSIYRNRNTNEYMIEIRDGSNAKVYYFDQDGKAILRSDNDDK